MVSKINEGSTSIGKLCYCYIAIIAIPIVENLVCHVRTKHIGVQYNFFQEKVLKGEIDLKHVNTVLFLWDVHLNPFLKLLLQATKKTLESSSKYINNH